MIEKTKYKQTRAMLFFILVFASFLHAQPANDGSRYRENSVLSSGKWIQMKVSENAVYKLTYEDIKKQGIDPAKVKIYGYGGWILNEDFSQPFIDDLPEVAVYLNKGSDGIFSPGDYLLFYGRGTTKWTYNSSKGVYEHENNPYSTFGSYFLTEGNSGPKEMQTLPSSTTAGALTVTAFDDYAVYDKDSVSILYSGRELFSESFINKPTSQSFSFTVPGITSDPGKARLSFAAAPTSITPVKLSIGGQEILSSAVGVPIDFYQKASMVDNWGNWNGEKTEKVTATVSYNSANQTIAYLNCIALNMKRTLQFYNTSYTFFRNQESRSNAIAYSIGNATASCQVWDVTQNFDAALMESKLNDSQLQFQISPSGNTLRELAMVDLSKSFSTPEFIGEVKNQNLHALPPTDMVILSPTAYMVQAEKLAEAHRAEGLRVTVVDDRLVFNEFSSGAPEATAYRRFMKMFYDRAASEADKPKYLLLFGDGLFDNRHLTPEGNRLNSKFYLLTYQVKESVNELYSYGTDDYFGFLDDNEGRNLASDKLDLGIGRFPVSSVTQAEDAVNKVISYMGNTQYGNWKSKLIFTADNTDTNEPGYEFAIHASQADELAEYMNTNFPEYTSYKYYLDAYKLVTVNGKISCPDTKKAVFNKLKEGCFLFNYTGHGSITDLTSEGLVNISDIRQMNFPNLPLWITATCDVGWFDGLKTSAGETAFLNKTSGAIALYTTTRVVSSAQNSAINKQFMRYLFTKENNKHLRLGDIFRLSKIQLGLDNNKLNYVLLGDPALVLNYPEWNVQLESINGQPIPKDEDLNFRALDKITLSGIITDESGNKADNFKGTLKTNVFNSRRTIQSVSADKDGGRFSYDDYPSMIYSGNSEIKDGAFNLTFNVPLDISYSKTNGKINFYAYDQQSKKDATGSFQKYVLAGTSDNLTNDGKGPEIKSLYLNTKSFRNGDYVNETPFFSATVADKNGINLTGIGHEIVITIDNKWTYFLNNNYEIIDYYEWSDAILGTVGFSIPELPAGIHHLTFKVWNILNNSTTDSLTFNVKKGYQPVITDLQARENPARINTFFVLDHNLPETSLTVEIGVYDLTGRMIWMHSEKGSSGFLRSYPIEWKLTNSAGNRVPPGVYVYRATIRTATSKEVTKAKKIIVLGQ